MTSRALLALSLLFAGCAMTPSDPTWVEDLQVIAVQVQPPVLAPNVPVTVTVTVLDPEGRGADIALWACTDVGRGCIERELSEAAGLPLSTWARSGPLRDDRFVAKFDLRIPTPVLQRAADDGAHLVLWAVACADGACDVVRRIAADPEPGTLAFARAAEMLESPEAWLADIERGSASAAVKLVPIRHTVDNQNPRVTAEVDGLVVPLGSDGGRVRLHVLDDGARGRSPRIHAFSTFGPVSGRLDDPPDASIHWTAPGDPGSGRIYAVVHDGAGGVGVWRGQVAVQE